MERLKELLNFVICIVVILAVAYFSGFLKGFSGADFKDAYNRIATNLTVGAKSSKVTEYLRSETTANSTSDNRFNNYRIQSVSKNVLDGSRDSRAWTNIFTSAKKVVFYIYDNKDDEKEYSVAFHKDIQSYAEKYKLDSSYNFQPQTKYAFDHYSWGITGASNICNSIKECNDQRKISQNYTLLTDFLARCGRTMCIIDAKNGKYVMLKKRDSNEAEKMLKSLKDW